MRRLLGVSEAQLKSWERQKLVMTSETYGFRELLALRSLIQLRKDRVAPSKIRSAIHALVRKLAGITDPLTQLKMYAHGKRVRVEVGGRAMEAESGQLLLDFDAKEISRLLEFRDTSKDKKAQKDQRDQRAQSEHWFQRGLELEQAAAPFEEIAAAYRKAIELDPRTAGALVNLGTLYFNARKWAEAERNYKQALEIDPDYALAHFDLGNLYDELGDQRRALEQYQEALRVSPAYADAHYNVALLYQGTNQTMKAVRHWNEYLKLDPASQWATIARRELTKLRQAAVVEGSRA